jgi:hypothetical protein
VKRVLMSPTMETKGTEMIVYIIMCLVCGGASAAIAGSKGRHPGGWFALGSLFGLFALIAVIAMPALGRTS